MQYFGELISIGVAFSWTATALLSEFGSKRMGNLTLNVARMGITLVFSCILFWAVTGSPLPAGASREAYLWMMLSGLVGYVIGDFCLFQCYIIIGSKFGQLFMTLAPITAAIMAWITLGEHISAMGIVAMLVTLTGIAISVLGRGGDGHHKLVLNLPLNGVLFAVGAAVCQGVGLVLSKIGMNHYSQDIPADAPRMMESMMPFAATMMRAMVGALGFIAIMGLQKNLHKLVQAPKDRKGFSYAMLTTFFGPFLGVGFSLMAVQYTNAGIAQTLMALTPVLIILPYCLIYKQKVKFREMIGVTLSMAGVAMFFLL